MYISACKIHLSETTANILTELGGFVLRQRENFQEKVGSLIISEIEKKKQLRKKIALTNLCHLPIFALSFLTLVIQYFQKNEH